MNGAPAPTVHSASKQCTLGRWDPGRDSWAAPRWTVASSLRSPGKVSVRSLARQQAARGWLRSRGLSALAAPDMAAQQCSLSAACSLGHRCEIVSPGVFIQRPSLRPPTARRVAHGPPGSLRMIWPPRLSLLGHPPALTGAQSEDSVPATPRSCARTRAAPARACRDPPVQRVASL